MTRAKEVGIAFGVSTAITAGTAVAAAVLVWLGSAAVSALSLSPIGWYCLFMLGLMTLYCFVVQKNNTEQADTALKGYSLLRWSPSKQAYSLIRPIALFMVLFLALHLVAERRLAETKRLEYLEEERRLALVVKRLERRLAEAERLEAQYLNEESRLALEAKRLEAQHREAERRLAEAERLAAQHLMEIRRLALVAEGLERRLAEANRLETERLEEERLDLWQKARVSRDSRILKAWLHEYPSSPHVKEARRLLEDLLFEAAQSRRSVEAARRYLEVYPQGRYTPQVRQIESQALAWQRIREMDTVAAYRRYAGDASQPQDYRIQARERTQVYHWRQRLDQGPTTPDVLTQLAEACIAETACTLKMVEDLYRQALELDPQYARALLGLAKIFYNKEESDQVTRQLLEQAIALDPDNAESHLYLGRLLARGMRCRESLAHYDRALSLDPDLVEALFHRGVCKARLGHCRDANDDFRRVILLTDDPQSKLVQRARQHLMSCRP